MIRPTRILAVAIAVAGVSMVNGVAAHAIPPGPPTRSASTQVSFAATTFDPAEGENVALTGDLHVVTQLSGSATDGWALDWHVNVGHVTGTGETSGDSYVINGAAGGTVAIPPGPPGRTAILQTTFSLFPPGPPVHPPSPCRFQISVSFDDGGHVTNIDAHVDGSPTPTTD